MKHLLIVGLLLAVPALADENDEIASCLKAWKKHPFGKHPAFKTLKANVNIMGIGGKVHDEEITEKPQLVLVKHSVSVMSKQTYKLMNPKGWYCLKGPVAVLGKSQVEIHCKAQLASSDEGIAIAASNEDTGGVAVLGKIKVDRTCP